MPAIRRGEAWSEALRTSVRSSTAKGWNVYEHRDQVRLELRQTGQPKQTVTLPFDWSKGAVGDVLTRVRNIYILVAEGHFPGEDTPEPAEDEAPPAPEETPAVPDVAGADVSPPAPVEVEAEDRADTHATVGETVLNPSAVFIEVQDVLDERGHQGNVNQGEHRRR